MFRERLDRGHCRTSFDSRNEVRNDPKTVPEDPWRRTQGGRRPSRPCASSSSSLHGAAFRRSNQCGWARVERLHQQKRLPDPVSLAAWRLVSVSWRLAWPRGPCGCGGRSPEMECSQSASPMPSRITVSLPSAVMGALDSRPPTAEPDRLAAAGRRARALGSYWALCTLPGTGARAFLDVPVARMATWLWVLAFAAVMFILLLYPTGRLVSRRWRPVAWAVVVWGVLGVPAVALAPEFANPAVGPARPGRGGQ